MNNPEKNIPKVLIPVMITVTILYSLMLLVAIGILGAKMSNYVLQLRLPSKKPLVNGATFW